VYSLEVEDAGRIVVRRSNGDMVWTSSLFTNWNSGEPNNSGGIEHRAVAYRSICSGCWMDRSIPRPR
jgi:hypothetical protein